jgi:diguanylate cyclase (GGDEF)-like protein
VRASELHSRRGFLIGFVLVSLSLYLGVDLVAPSGVADAFRSVYYLIFPLCAAVMSVLAARKAHPADRLFIGLMAGGVNCLFVAEVLWAARQNLAPGDGPPDSIAFDIAITAGHLLLVVFVGYMLVSRLGSLRPLERAQALLDGAIALVLLWSGMALLVVDPYLVAGGTTAGYVTLGFTFVDLAILAGLVTIIRTGDTLESASWQSLAALGAGLAATAHAILGILTVEGVFVVGSLQNTLLDVVWMAAYLAIALASGRFIQTSDATVVRRAPAEPGVHWTDLIPAVLAIIFAPGIMWAAYQQAETAWVYIGWTVAATTLSLLVAARAAVLMVSNRELASMSATDPLTGVNNRRSFFDLLRLEMARVERGGGELAVVLVDLDEFRSVNETRGHLAGDQCLRLVASVLRDAVRGLIDIPCRIGGDEFGLILPSAGAGEAVLVCERIRALLGARQKGTDDPVTLSAGVAVFPAHAQTIDELLDAADVALYRAKHSGRDRAVVFDLALNTDLAAAEGARSARGAASPEAAPSSATDPAS